MAPVKKPMAIASASTTTAENSDIRAPTSTSENTSCPTSLVLNHASAEGGWKREAVLVMPARWSGCDTINGASSASTISSTTMPRVS